MFSNRLFSYPNTARHIVMFCNIASMLLTWEMS